VLCASYLDLEANCEKPVSYLLGMALEKFLMQEIELGRIRSLSHNFPLVRSVELGDFAPASGELALGPDDFENREIELAESPEAYAHLLWSETIQQQARLALERWLETRPGAFGGVIGGFADYKREDLSTISPSRLAEYLGCPFAYWMSRILKIAPLEEPEQVREFEPKGKGELVHRALHSLLQEIMKNNLGQDQSQALKKLAEFLENRGREYLREEYQAQEELIANELDNIYFYLANIYQQLLPAPECRKVLSEEKIDSQKVELEFEPGRKVRLAGLIDRVDMEGTDVKVIDYKVAGSGESFRKDPLRQLQLPIYLFSVVNMFGLNPESASAGFLLMNLKPFALPEKSLLITGKNFPKHLQALRQLVKIMIDGIESGVFAPAQQKCDYCDYAQTCFATTASFRPKLRTGWLQELLATIDRCNFLKIENEK
jgi:RecB family exonuclease